MPKRKKPSQIYLAWERIVFGDDKYSSESRQTWAALWQQHCEGEALMGTLISDAALLCSLGYDQAAHQGDWHAAKERIERYFQHPKWEANEPVSQLIAQALLSRALWECGEENPALQLWVSLIRKLGKNQRLACLLVLHELLAICQSGSETGHARNLFSGVVREVIEKLTKTKLPPLEIPENWQGFTYGELAALLESARTARAKKESQ
ncbi:hypothetical protein [Armatimonas sp.]|uniref:hypothetical protein n=1 Tax=Armatimonas sp. TaxID=1872638 RepID=UPI003752C176